MELYILRHADADTVAASDDERALSDKGRKQSKRVASFCRDNDLKPEVILCSPLLRAQQTAQPIAQKLGVEIETVPWLAYGTSPERVLEQLRERKDRKSIMLVGHEPDFGLLAAVLLGMGKEGAIRVRKGSLILLEVIEIQSGGAQLEWSIPVRLM